MALLVFVVGMHWLVALKPETGADGLAMHLAIPANMAAHHQMTYGPERFLWSVMPMGADWAFSITYLLGGESAPRLLNFAMLLVVLALLYEMVRRWLPRGMALLLLAAFAATPLVQLVTGSLFVENVLTALLLGALAALWRYADTGEARFFVVAALLGGTAMGVKLAAMAMLAMMIPFAVVAARRQAVGAGRGGTGAGSVCGGGGTGVRHCVAQDGRPVVSVPGSEIPIAAAGPVGGVARSAFPRTADVAHAVRPDVSHQPVL